MKQFGVLIQSSALRPEEPAVPDGNRNPKMWTAGKISSPHEAKKMLPGIHPG